LHEQAAGLVEWHRALQHRTAAAVGPDDDLASDLETAGREAHRLGRTAQAAAWLVQAAAASRHLAAADRRLLDALEILVASGEVAEAEVLAARMGAAGPGARRNWLLGALDFFAGRPGAAEERLRQAWQTHDRVRDASTGAAAATQLARLCLPFPPTGGDRRAWPGWRSCPPPLRRCRGRIPTRWCCGVWPGS
jgi:hypothetical protein